jgi:hypothetical protein
MNPRRLHSDTIFSIRTFSFGPAIIEFVSVRQLCAGVNQIFNGANLIGLTGGERRGLFKRVSTRVESSVEECIGRRHKFFRSGGKARNNLARLRRGFDRDDFDLPG